MTINESYLVRSSVQLDESTLLVIFDSNDRSICDLEWICEIVLKWHGICPIVYNWKEYGIYDYSLITDFMALPNNLGKLEAIELSEASFDHIWPFIRESIGLKRIVGHFLHDGTHCSEATNVIDLIALNARS